MDPNSIEAFAFQGNIMSRLRSGLRNAGAVGMYTSVPSNRVAEATTEEVFGSPWRPHGIGESGALLGD